jgi:hypothetical protein
MIALLWTGAVLAYVAIGVVVARVTDRILDATVDPRFAPTPHDRCADGAVVLLWPVVAFMGLGWCVVHGLGALVERGR